MKSEKAWVVSVNMGYGHQRTAFPLKSLAPGGEVINANDYKGIPVKDRRVWESSRYFYEFISRFKKIPLIGDPAFSLYNKFQQIPSYYPYRDLSRPTLSLKEIYFLIKKGWGRHLMQILSEKKIPLITTFFIPAFMAEAFDYPGEIYCVVCDADISRAWASLNPKNSRIKYFAPNSWVVNRLKLYGVKEENICLTGYPLPLENIGSKKSEILKEDLKNRLFNLDPGKLYCQEYEPLLMKLIGRMPKGPDHKLTLMFSIGGAGAQTEIIFNYIKSLEKKIKNNEINIVLSVGVRKEIKDAFIRNLLKIGLGQNIEKNIRILAEKNIWDYFTGFNREIRRADILWTKPSELSFYSGLGLPLILAPTIGSQEEYNKKWLLNTGSGIAQENPRYASQWIYDYINSGRFAKAAIRGFMEINNLGVYNIKEIVFK